MICILKDQIQNKLGLKHTRSSRIELLKLLKDQIQNKLGLKHRSEKLKHLELVLKDQIQNKLGLKLKMLIKIFALKLLKIKSKTN